MRKSIVLQGLVAVALAMAATTATADDFRGFYAGVGIGSAQVEDVGAFKERDTGFKLFGGYSFGRFLDIELSYMDAGTAENTTGLFALSFGDTLVDSSFQTKIDTKVVNLSAIGKLPITDKFSLFGKLGYASIDQDVDVRILTNNPATSFDFIASSQHEREISYGLGARYDVGKNFQLRAEYEDFDKERGDLEFISLSGVFRFR